MKSAPRLALVASILVPVSFLTAPIALGQSATSRLATELPRETKNETLKGQRAAAVSQTFVSDGHAVSLESLGVTVTPPAGWEVSTHTGSLAVVMREPRIEAPAYDKPKYQRNITVAAMHEASPIDAQRAAALELELQKTFGADPLVESFQIVEHKFFNYRGRGDGLLVYSSLTLSGYPMMQMHVLVSGQAKQFLLTYTDLAERFSDPQDGNFEKAWASIVSVEVTGLSPTRSDTYMRYGAGAGGFALFCLALMLIRRRATRFDYASEADAMIEASGNLGDAPSPSVYATMAGGWNLGRAKTAHGNESFSSLDFVTEAPRTRQTEYVSNY